MLAVLAVTCRAQGVSAPATVDPAQIQIAQRVAGQGVPLADLAPDAPASHTVRPGDTLWGLSQLFLKSPWRWAELWGMNMEQVRDPHRLYPGQVLVLSKGPDRATLKVATAAAAAQTMPVPTTGAQAEPATVKLLPRVRSGPVDDAAIASVPAHLIAPFIAQATVLEAGEIDGAARIVASPDGRMLMTTGDVAYVRGDLQGRRNFQLVREPRALRDPVTREILGYEARLVGLAEALATEDLALPERGESQPSPARVLLRHARLEIGPGDRLTQASTAEFAPFVPRAPARPVQGQVIGLYGEGLTAAQHQIVSLNRGSRDGVERGHVLALWRTGSQVTDRSTPVREALRLPDERNGQMYVFRVFDHVSYALILNGQDPVSPGARFTQP
ncbi:MAG: LysM domain-containing protein [Betaproteobacteria bacterium]